jgi:uncharacterized protein with NAD-binding domain and iron-sulfur cluster
VARQDEKKRRPPVKVAIVGGGCAGLAAAWHLSRQGGYEVHVYERSWRLGGKGASGRDKDGRIQEHGLHVWLGFYENAFRMVRQCYADVEGRGWGPHEKAPEKLAHGSFEDAFFPEPHIGVADENADRNWFWSGHLPPAKGLPGDPLVPETNPFTIGSYLLRCVDLLKTLMLSVVAPPASDAPTSKQRPGRRSRIDEAIDLDFGYDLIRSPGPLIESIASRVRGGTLTVAAAALQAVTIAENVLHDLNHSPQVVGSALNLLQALAAQARKQLRDFVSIDPALRWKTEIIDIVITIAVGLYRDRVLFGEKGLDAINDLDYRDWLRKHGATRTALNSRFIQGIYDLVFAYEDGDRGRPRLAAGVALRGALRMFFTYRGSMFWHMRSSMGDAVFAPLYKVMRLGGPPASTSDRKANGKARKARQGSGEPLPVRFHFLHELREVTLEEKNGQPFVETLGFVTAGDAKELDERSRDALDHFGCWPDGPHRFGKRSGPRWTGRRALQFGREFDAVILAMGVDDLKRVRGLRQELRPSEDVKTVATKSAQIWLTADLEALGWYRGPGVISALGLRFDTWADMTHTLASERAWRKARTGKASRDDARSVAYFCGVLSEADAGLDPAQVKRKVEADLQQMLSDEITRLWPAAKRSASVVDSRVQANVGGSDRYTLSLPRSIRHRISPLEWPVANATVAGDWTACGLDVGCVEAAVMSGMLAAHAITGAEPALESIVGFDHP